MSRYLVNLRRASFAVSVLFIGQAVMAQPQASDPATQRVAMACTQAADAHGCQHLATPAARRVATQHAGSDMTVAKLNRRAPEARPSVASSSDGSRFVYDSCGCSND